MIFNEFTKLEDIPSKYLGHVGGPVVQKCRMGDWGSEWRDCTLSAALSATTEPVSVSPSASAQTGSGLRQRAELSLIHLSIHSLIRMVFQRD